MTVPLTPRERIARALVGAGLAVTADVLGPIDAAGFAAAVGWAAVALATLALATAATGRKGGRRLTLR